MIKNKRTNKKKRSIPVITISPRMVKVKPRTVKVNIVAFQPESDMVKGLIDRHPYCNLSLRLKYKGNTTKKYYLLPSNFLGVFAHWLTRQQLVTGNEKIKHIEVLLNTELRKYILSFFYKNKQVPVPFTYKEIEEICDEKNLLKMKGIRKLNRLKDNFIDIGALSRNVFYDIIREYVLND